MLIFLAGSGALALYQVMAMEDQLDEMTQAVDKLDGNVKQAQYEKTKFFDMVRDLLILAPKDPNAEKIVTFYKLRQLQATQPELSSLNLPLNRPTTNAAPASATNAAPDEPPK